jgi:hypothetical protein
VPLIRRPRSEPTDVSGSEAESEGRQRSCVNCLRRKRSCQWDVQGKYKACLPCRENKQGCGGRTSRRVRKRDRSSGSEEERVRKRPKEAVSHSGLDHLARAIQALSEEMRRTEESKRKEMAEQTGALEALVKATRVQNRVLERLADAMEEVAWNRRSEVGDGSESGSDMEMEVGESGEEELRREAEDLEKEEGEVEEGIAKDAEETME